MIESFMEFQYRAQAAAQEAKREIGAPMYVNVEDIFRGIESVGGSVTAYNKAMISLWGTLCNKAYLDGIKEGLRQASTNAG